MPNHSIHLADELLVVLVVYESPLGQSATWQSLEAEAQRLDSAFEVLIYDNSRKPQAIPASGLRIHYQHDKTNSGVSRAYNEGCKLADYLKKKWLLLLDQDTRFPSAWLNAYASATNQRKNEMVIAPILHSFQKTISPFTYWVCLGRPAAKVSPGIHSLVNYNAINSGLLISVDLFNKAGGYDERLPLDFSDFAFMHKLKAMKVQLHVINLIAEHGLSSGEDGEKSNAETRFRLYCNGSRRYASYTRRPVIHFLVCGLRAMKLSFRFKSPSFLTVFFRAWATA